jgi:hypothetical protein
MWPAAGAWWKGLAVPKLGFAFVAVNMPRNFREVKEIRSAIPA